MFPTEMAFSERMIPTLVKNGVQWVIVPNNHISRAVENYKFSTEGDNNDPPNRADQVCGQTSVHHSRIAASSATRVGAPTMQNHVLRSRGRRHCAPRHCHHHRTLSH